MPPWEYWPERLKAGAFPWWPVQAATHAVGPRITSVRAVQSAVAVAWSGEYAGGYDIVARAMQAVTFEWLKRGPATALTQGFPGLHRGQGPGRPG